MAEKVIQIYTDGSSRGNPGPGGYGTILVFSGKEKELSEGFRRTTNNRMELLAVIRGLQALKTTEYPVQIYSDSKYVVDAIQQGWIFGWMKKSFKGKKNKDLWMLWYEVQKPFKIEYIWVKGHAGHHYNERCDELAVNAALSQDLLVDTFFEQTEAEDNQLL